jgi:hypothetical protein
MGTRPSDYYIDTLGWSLCAIAPATKRPLGNGWQASPMPSDHWARHPDHGCGVIHGPSGTCTLDVDDVEATRADFAERGIDLDLILSEAVRIVGHPDRAKAIYRMPAGVTLRRVSYRGAYELRGGMTQDVLPPSIHPGTGQPYAWHGDPEEITELPAELLALWRELAAPKKATRKEAAAPQRAFEGVGGGGSVIEAWDRSIDVGDVLERYGYVPCGARWCAPTSSSGDPGVVLLPDASPPRVYSHHASDPLGDGHSHGSFSVWCRLAHGDDVKAAVKDAARILGMDGRPPVSTETLASAEALLRDIVEEVEEEAQDAERVFEAAPPARAAWPGPIPCALLRSAYDWIACQTHAPKAGAVTQATLAFAAAISGRRYETPHGKPASAFLGITDSSSAGHRPLKGIVYRLLAACGERGAIRGTGFASGVQLARALHRSPRMLWITDELGHMCSMSRRQQSGALESALSQLVEVYDAPTLYLDPETLARGQKLAELSECDVVRPSLAALFMVPYDQLGHLSARGEYGRGTLQQILLADAGDPVSRHRHLVDEEEPRQVIEVATRMRDAADGPMCQDASPSNPLPAIRVQMDAEAWAAITAGAAALRAMTHPTDLQPYRGMAHGYLQSALRVASIIAAWDAPSAPVVTEEIARWACGWAAWCLQGALEELRVHGSDNGDKDIEQRVLDYLRRYPERPYTERELSRAVRPYRALPPDRRSAILHGLVEDGLICRTERKGVAGRPTAGYSVRSPNDRAAQGKS